MSAPTIPAELILQAGSTLPFDVFPFDANGAQMPLEGADRAVVAIKKTLSATAFVLIRSTADANLTIDTANRRLVCSFANGAEADALPPGRYRAQARVRYGSADSWRLSDPFSVRIVPAMAPSL